MPQSVCTLGGITFPYNPYPSQDFQPRSIAYQETLGGGFYTDFGIINADRRFKLEWMIMDRTFYNQLYTLYTAASTQYTYVDPYGNSFTVIMMSLEPKSFLMGGDDAIENVSLELARVS